MNSLNFKIVTPEKTVLSQELVSLSCFTTLGQITILPGHVPLVATLVAGELHARTNTNDFFIFVAGGFVEVQPGNKVTILADAAEHHYEIDEAQAEEAKNRAKADLEGKLSETEYAKVAASLEKSLARLTVVRRHAHRRKQNIGENTLSE